MLLFVLLLAAPVHAQVVNTNTVMLRCRTTAPAVAGPTTHAAAWLRCSDGTLQLPPLGISPVAVGTAVASAATIAPTAPITHITGITAVVTITPPAGCAAAGRGCTILLIPDGLFTTTATGNIALASSAVVNKVLAMTYDNATSKFYPSY